MLLSLTTLVMYCNISHVEHPWKVGKFTSGSNPVVLWSGLTNDYREFTYRMDDAKTSLPYGETYVRYYPGKSMQQFG